MSKENEKQPPVGIDALLVHGLYIIETRPRNRNKELGPWQFVAAFVSRDDAYNFYGCYHQNRIARILRPNTGHDRSMTTALLPEEY